MGGWVGGRFSVSSKLGGRGSEESVVGGHVPRILRIDLKFLIAMHPHKIH